MKKNRVTLIIALILLLAAAALYLTTSRSTLKRSATDFAVDDTANITKLFLADKNNKEVTLTRTTDGWLVDGKFQAQQAKINSFLKTLTDLEVRAPVPLAARNNVIKRMSVLAKKIEIYQVVPRIHIFGIDLFPHTKRTKVYYIGDVTQDNQGTFMLMEGAEEPYVVHIAGFRGFVASRYSTLASDWRDYTVFKAPINRIRSVKVEFPQKPDESYQIDIENNRKMILEALSTGQMVTDYDTIRALNLLTSFEDVRFEALLDSMLQRNFIDSVITSTPKTIITLTDNDGKVNTVKLFSKPGFGKLYSADGAALEPLDLDRAYALVNDDRDFVLVQYYVFDKVTRTLDYLRDKADK